MSFDASSHISRAEGQNPFEPTPAQLAFTEAALAAAKGDPVPLVNLRNGGLALKDWASWLITVPGFQESLTERLELRNGKRAAAFARAVTTAFGCTRNQGRGFAQALGAGDKVFYAIPRALL
ncbi:MAG: hypothetical protein HYZ11_08265 [Candidatus Tectomicrobia bacterium]|uniref:Uncharacterized protein n=1 Tax=Tectimicrobiota bacterium TaxID=2528274 RepID=A0A932I1B8_UNCTE|nr:hypothetical protein [Candidatus Tectomicrobia bacterium]